MVAGGWWLAYRLVEQYLEALCWDPTWEKAHRSSASVMSCCSLHCGKSKPGRFGVWLMDAGLLLSQAHRRVSSCVTQFAMVPMHDSAAAGKLQL